MVLGFSKHFYSCQCDRCKEIVIVEQNNYIYNGAQAVRSLGWSFGKDKRVLCKYCRRSILVDRYRGMIK